MAKITLLRTNIGKTDLSRRSKTGVPPVEIAGYIYAGQRSESLMVALFNARKDRLEYFGLNINKLKMLLKFKKKNEKKKIVITPRSVRSAIWRYKIPR